MTKYVNDKDAKTIDAITDTTHCCNSDDVTTFRPTFHPAQTYYVHVYVYHIQMISTSTADDRKFGLETDANLDVNIPRWIGQMRNKRCRMY